MTIILKKAESVSDPQDPLTWGIWEREGGRKMVVIVDSFGRKAAITGRDWDGHNWQISPDGTVTPSIFCHANHEGGDWHEFVKLEGWES
jgi:hypothetical protein